MAEDMLQLQQEAARRVRRMQEHSRQVFEEHQGRTAESLAAARAVPPPPPERRRSAPPPPCPPAADAYDREQWLLLGLAFLLWRCGCRTELVLALLYLAL